MGCCINHSPNRADASFYFNDSRSTTQLISKSSYSLLLHVKTVKQDFSTDMTKRKFKTSCLLITSMCELTCKYLHISSTHTVQRSLHITFSFLRLFQLHNRVHLNYCLPYFTDVWTHYRYIIWCVNAVSLFSSWILGLWWFFIHFNIKLH